MERLAGDVAGVVRGEETRCVGDLLGSAPTGERNPFHETLSDGLLAEQFEGRDPEDVAVHRGHALQVPVHGRLVDAAVDAAWRPVFLLVIGLSQILVVWMGGRLVVEGSIDEVYERFVAVIE